MLGRPREYEPELLAGCIEDYLEGIPEEGFPIISEFCCRNGVTRASLYRLAGEDERLGCALDTMQAMKEARLERLALEKKINPTMAIFSLKQMGWSDRVQQQVERSQTIHVEWASPDNTGQGEF